jgi:hypothetical protein
VYDILLENNADAEKTFVISVEDIPEDWYSLSHESIDVAAGESEFVYLFITPQPSLKTEYTGSVIVNGIETEFQLKLIKEHDIQVSMPSQTVSCVCEEDQTFIRVENLGKFSEEIELTFSGEALEIIDVEVESFTLEPNETREIQVFIEDVCDADERNYNLEVMANSRNSYASSTTSATIRKIECFDFELDYPEEVRACEGVEEVFIISVTNVGIRQDSYEVNIEALGYSDLIELEPGQVQNFEVTFIQEEEGVYEIPFVVSSDIKEERGVVSFIVERCFGVDLELDVDEITIQAGTGELTKPSVKNVGTKPDTYKIESSATWVAVRPEEVTLSPNETHDVYVYYSPEYGAVGEFDVELSAESETSIDRETVRVNVEGEPIETTTTTLGTTSTTLNETSTTLETPTTTLNETTTTLETPTTITVQESTTTTLIIEPPEINITQPVSRVWEWLVNVSENLNEQLEDLGINKMVLSLIIGFVVALIILGIIYFIVMRE